MSEFERRIKELWSRITAGLSSSAKTAGRKRDESTANLRRGATARAQQAAAKARDLRDTETAKKATSALHDLREGEAAKKAEAAIHDLRGTETAKKAESAIAERDRRPAPAGARQEGRGERAQGAARPVLRWFRLHRRYPRVLTGAETLLVLGVWPL
jgi:hypothetical protein